MPRKRPAIDLDNLSLDRGETGAVARPAPGRPALEGVGAAPVDEIDAIHAAMGELEGNLQQGVSEVMDAFKANRKAELSTRDANIDSQFWVALVFQSKQHKQEFLRKAGLIDMGDNYLCGEDVAQRLGIEMELPIPGMPKWNVKQSLHDLTNE